MYRFVKLMIYVFLILSFDIIYDMRKNNFPQLFILNSKKIEKALNDMSRFDIYTVGRIFHLKSENDDSVNSEKWISML